MNLLFSLSLAGSLVLLLYFVIRPAAMRYLPAAWRYRLLKTALLFYLLPYQYLKYGYMAIWSLFFPRQQQIFDIADPHITACIRRMILVDPNGRLHFRNQVLIFAALGVWIVLAVTYLIYHLVKYIDCMRELQQITNLLITLPCAADKRRTSEIRVSLLANQHITTPFTVGMIFPRIILPASLVNKKECKMIISHELAHVRNHDNILKLLCLFAILLHWYNPFIYMLYWEICKVSEQVCDAAVIQGMSRQETEQYKLLIIELGKKEPHTDVLLVSPFNGKFRMIRERITVMNKKTSSSKKICIAASLLTVLLLLALSPVSVLAYSPTPPCEYQDDQINIGDDSDALCFSLGQTDSQDIYDPFGEYGTESDIFIDANGQAYIHTDTNPGPRRIFCFHDWVDGTLYSHSKQDDGGCMLYAYDARMCTYCHSCKNVTLRVEYHFVKCPH